MEQGYFVENKKIMGTGGIRETQCLLRLPLLDCVLLSENVYNIPLYLPR